MKKIYLFAISVMLLATSCGHKKEGDVTLIRPVKTATASSQSVIRKDFSGIVEAVEYVKLAFRVSGQVINLPVVEGQRVKKGQLIAAIDPRDISLQYAADKAAYETAAAQVERNKRLLGRQAISVQEYEISVANYQKAKSAYELSSNNMRDTKLTAPFDGSIEKRLVENYQRVNSGEGIVQLVNTQKLRIKFTVPDDYLYLLRAKDVTFKVVFDTYPGTTFNAKLEEYLDISTAGTGIPVTITIEDPAFNRSLYDVKPGFTCKIKLASDVAPFLEEKLVNIPLSAIFGESENQKTYVWVVKDNKVSKREVTVYSPTGEANALISAGIQPGETIVIAGVHQLVDGQTVKVIN
ncbi:efflux RND transporter periplasmic adaptor subunit [Bacteroides cellulosilyticus]|uniref:efflux RND transporter periplasmic adaptor subunit n=1 Tax=Bacteroides cellulosilyticus TaxID=246787 RepID=UPI00189D57B7|nr:efflux RND transporter periplasmic adaptor subunit [Bacteroides cellulosilyticus]